MTAQPKDSPMSHDRIFSLHPRVPFHDEAGEAALHQVETHWRNLRANQLVPNRADIGSGALSPVLSHTFVLERVTPSVARFRVAGQAIHGMLNMEPRGMPISAIFTPMGRQMLAPLIYDVCEGPELVEIPLIAQRGLARSPLRARLLMLPIKTTGPDINGIFGAIVIDGRAGRRSLRFDFDSDGTMRTEPLGPVIRTVHEVMTDDDEDVPQVAARTIEPVLPHELRQLDEPRQPGLRLVVDNT